jgi:hypothetical protein
MRNEEIIAAMPAIIDTYKMSGLPSVIPIAVPTMRTRRPRMKYAGEFFSQHLHQSNQILMMMMMMRKTN